MLTVLCSIPDLSIIHVYSPHLLYSPPMLTSSPPIYSPPNSHLLYSPPICSPLILTSHILTSHTHLLYSPPQTVDPFRTGPMSQSSPSPPLPTTSFPGLNKKSGTRGEKALNHGLVKEYKSPSRFRAFTLFWKKHF